MLIRQSRRHRYLHPLLHKKVSCEQLKGALLLVFLPFQTNFKTGDFCFLRLVLHRKLLFNRFNLSFGTVYSARILIACSYLQPFLVSVCAYMQPNICPALYSPGLCRVHLGCIDNSEINIILLSTFFFSAIICTANIFLYLFSADL